MVQVFLAALTTHDIDADSAVWTHSSIITDDRSSCRFSDDEEVSEYMYIIMLQLCKSRWCEWKSRQYLCCEIFSFSVIHAVRTHNFESLSVAHVLSMCTDTDSHDMHKYKWSSPIPCSIENCPVLCHVNLTTKFSTLPCYCISHKSECCH